MYEWRVFRTEHKNIGKRYQIESASRFAVAENDAE
jgi:hypothetical protein